MRPGTGRCPALTPRRRLRPPGLATLPRGAVLGMSGPAAAGSPPAAAASAGRVATSVASAPVHASANAGSAAPPDGAHPDSRAVEEGAERARPAAAGFTWNEAEVAPGGRDAAVAVTPADGGRPRAPISVAQSVALASARAGCVPDTDETCASSSHVKRPTDPSASSRSSVAAAPAAAQQPVVAGSPTSPSAVRSPASIVRSGCPQGRMIQPWQACTGSCSAALTSGSLRDAAERTPSRPQLPRGPLGLVFLAVQSRIDDGDPRPSRAGVEPEDDRVCPPSALRPRGTSAPLHVSGSPA